MDARGPDEPPPDVGVATFVASFLALPIVVAVLFATSTRIRTSPAFLVTYLGLILAAFAGLSVWAYFSKSRASVVIKSTLAGAAILVPFVLYWALTTKTPAGDDVAPLIFIVIGPMLILTAAGVALLSAFVALGVTAIRQRARVVWLQRVREGAHAHYRIGPMAPEDAKKPLFLRYRTGDRALRRWSEGDYRDSPQGDVIARVPFQ